MWRHHEIVTRREVVLGACAAAIGSAALPGSTQSVSTLAVEGYIFQQYAERTARPLEAITGQVLSMAHAAGFRNIELNPAFFAPEAKQPTLDAIREQGLRMPSLYVGGSMHENALADRTIANALDFGKLCAPFGCRAIVTNPDPKPGGVSKSDTELDIQAAALNRMGGVLAQQGFELRVHHHTPQLVENAREWRHILHHTNPAQVKICVDVDWAYEGGFSAVPFLHEVGDRLREIHVRSAKDKVWLEDLEPSDIDYPAVARYLRQAKLVPLVVVELAYRPNTKVTRSLAEDLRLSRLYAEQVFGIPAGA